ncbi:M28 family peptidase [Pelosinus sp. sgz500959]|uniref:M28 family peptidase n=1 Tax=Pelosinus sp. sgz500959 TaxID=3242472 RepID=UPI00366ED656
MEKTAEKLIKHVFSLSQTIGNRNVEQKEALDRTANYIDEEFQDYGYQVDRQCYSVSGEAYYEPFCMDKGNRDTPSVKACNIIATKIGKEYPNEIMIIGAHYDTCENPGADDNASGIAGMLEIARLLSGITTKRTIKFIAFANEEPPFFHTDMMGSLVYSKDARQ